MIIPVPDEIEAENDAWWESGAMFTEPGDAPSLALRFVETRDWRLARLSRIGPRIPATNAVRKSRLRREPTRRRVRFVLLLR